MVTMKVYDRKDGRSSIEIYPANKDQLMCIRYSNSLVHLSVHELSQVIGFLSKIRDNMAIMGTEVKDAHTKV
jgi:hypothetical protein